MFFEYSDYEIFLQIIPKKEYTNFVNSHISRGLKSSFKEHLIDLTDLKEKEIIIEEEFIEKKKILLDKVK